LTDFPVDRVREQFPALDLTVGGRGVAYFDGPGGTQVPDGVLAAVARYYTERNANRHGAFITSEKTEETIRTGREKMAALLGADPDEIAFGANMTTLNFSLARALGRTLRPGDEVLITDMDHEANRDPWLDLREEGAVVRSVPMRLPECTVDMDELERMLNRRTRIIAIGWASNLSGAVVDLDRVQELARTVDATLVVDAVHYVPHLPADVHAAGCDFLLCSPYKFFGPHLGVLYGRREAFERLPTHRARAQRPTVPEKIETGTANHEGIAGTAAACDFIAGISGDGADLRCDLVCSMQAIAKYEDGLNRRLMRGLSDIDGAVLYGPAEDDRRTPTVSFTLRKRSPREVAQFLGERGIFVGDGHFYALTVVEKLGLAPTGGVVRAGIAPYNTEEEVDALLQGIEDIS